jgi:hypothetical protein
MRYENSFVGRNPCRKVCVFARPTVLAQRGGFDRTPDVIEAGDTSYGQSGDSRKGAFAPRDNQTQFVVLCEIPTTSTNVTQLGMTNFRTTYGNGKTIPFSDPFMETKAMI